MCAMNTFFGRPQQHQDLGGGGHQYDRTTRKLFLSFEKHPLRPIVLRALAAHGGKHKVGRPPMSGMELALQKCLQPAEEEEGMED